MGKNQDLCNVHYQIASSDGISECLAREAPPFTRFIKPSGQFYDQQSEQKMRFTIMTWVPSKDNAKVGTIFGILDADAPGALPLLPDGHWEDYHVADEQTFKLAKEAKKAIAQHGYYLLGAGETPSDAFGMS